MREPELVGGALFDTVDPVEASRTLAELLGSDKDDASRARDAGLEPVLVESLKRKLPLDPRSIQIACASGAAWVLGWRSAQVDESWEVVASLPGDGDSMPRGLRRTTGETLIGLATAARSRIRLASPYVDEPGIALLTDAIAAATRRGVVVDIFDPVSWQPARSAMAALRQRRND